MNYKLKYTHSIVVQLQTDKHWKETWAKNEF